MIVPAWRLVDLLWMRSSFPDPGAKLLFDANGIPADYAKRMFVSRPGGDEFALILEDLPGRTTATSVASKLLAAMRAPFSLGGIEVRVGTSIGSAFFAEDDTVDELVMRADQSMYRAKRGGRNRFDADHH